MTARTIARTAFRALLYLYAVVYCCPVELAPIGPDVDASWQLGLNLAAEQGLQFGEDVLWPSGPFAYLDSPMPVGDNLAKGLLVQGIVWLAAALALADLYFMQQLPLRGLSVLTGALMVGAPLFHFNTQGLDNLAGWTALLLAASATCSQRWRLRLYAAAAFAGAVITFKLSAAVIAGLGVVGAAAAVGKRSRQQRVEALACVATIGPLAGALAYWAHNPSLGGLLSYLSSMRELAAGYSTAMAVAGPADELWMALAVGAAFLLITALLLQQRQRAEGVALLLVLPLLVSFKHGFVRQDVHIANFFCFAVIAMGVSLAFADRGFLTPRLAALVVMPMLFVGLRTSVEARVGWVRSTSPIDVFVRTLSGAASLQAVPAAFDLDSTQERLLAESHRLHQEVGRELPAQLVEAVGSRPTAVLSPLSGLAHLAGLDVRVAGVVQKYSAYTPALDRFLADWIDDGAPDLLLFEWIAIDGRHPLLETPQSWMAMWRSFDTTAAAGDWVLLERRRRPRFGALSAASVLEVDAARGFELPDGPAVSSLESELTGAGRAMRGLFRIGPVSMEIRRSDGAVGEFRALPEVLGSPGLSSRLPMSSAELARILAPDASADAIPAMETMQLGGPGWRWYVAPQALRTYRME